MGVPHQYQDQYLEAFRRGEESGFTYFFRELHKPLCLFADRLVNRMDVAEDIVSDVFLRVWEKRAGFNGTKALKSYLYMSVRNGCINYLKRENKTPVSQSGDIDRSVLDNMIYAEVLHNIYQTIEDLPVKSRRIFIKLFIEGKTVNEISTELNLAVSTINTQKARALAFIRGRLSPIPVWFFLCIPLFY